jgi:RND family efflux transporter MFP subunit
LVLALAVFIAPLLVMACDRGQAHAPASKPLVPVRVAAVEYRSIAPPILATGLLSPKDEADLSFKIAGVIERILVEEGDAVRGGQPLASLDPREIDAHLSQAGSGLEKAERDLERARRLFADSVATLEQVQDAETGLAVARAGFQAVEFDQGHAVITAPSDGVILRRSAEPGEMVAPGRPVIAFGGTTRGSIVRVGLADRDAVRAHRGDPAMVVFRVDPEHPVRGTVSEVAAATDPATGTFRVEVAVPGASRFASGLVAEVEIRPANAETMALIPVDALLEVDGRRGSIYALDDTRTHVERRDIEIAFLDGDLVAVRSGLAGVEHVVRDGAARLDHGDSVVVMP